MPVTIKRNSKNFEAVILLQAMLQELNYSVVINAVFDPALEQAVEQFQLVNNLVADGIVGPKTWQVLYLRSHDYLSVSTKRFIEEIDLINAAKKLTIEVAAMKAINEVQSEGMGFINDFPVITFKRHIFWQRLIAYGQTPHLLVTSDNGDILGEEASNRSIPAEEIKRLKRAQLLHEKAALEATAWGAFHIMGYHWKALGYRSINAFVSRMKESEGEQLHAFVEYLNVNNIASLLRLKTGQSHLNLRHFSTFARAYNGKQYAQGRYHTKMLSAYKRYRQKTDALFAELAAVFINAAWNQDRIQNEILNQLLNSFYSAQSVEKKVPEHSKAFNAVRDNKLNHPLYRIKQTTDLDHIDINMTDFFVRDFMQVHSHGGTNKQTPMVIGEHSNNPNERNGLNISDDILMSSFAQHFDWMTEEVNKTLAQKNFLQEARYLSDMAHRDAIQLIPFSQSVSHFAGATMQHVQVMGNRISSTGQLQGIFASDGAFKHLHICNNSLDIRGRYTISINGMLSGKIEGNTDMNQRLLPKEDITLLPLRIGGGANIYILSFSNAHHLRPHDADYYAYEKITGSQTIMDLRQQPSLKTNASNWENVDMIALQTRYNATHQQIKRLRKQGANQIQIKRKWQQMMQQVGDEVLVSDVL